MSISSQNKCLAVWNLKRYLWLYLFLKLKVSGPISSKYIGKTFWYIWEIVLLPVAADSPNLNKKLVLKNVSTVMLYAIDVFTSAYSP